MLYGTSRVEIARAQGQSATSAFWSEFAASGFSIGSKGYGGMTSRTLVTAGISGTVSEVTGGKFANGTVTGAFVHLFNAEFHDNLASKIAFGTQRSKDIAARNVAYGMGKIADVAGTVSAVAGYSKNIPLAIGAGIVATTATTLQYAISPDNHSPGEIINSYLKPAYQSTDLH